MFWALFCVFLLMVLFNLLTGGKYSTKKRLHYSTFENAGLSQSEIAFAVSEATEFYGDGIISDANPPGYRFDSSDM